MVDIIYCFKNDTIYLRRGQHLMWHLPCFDFFWQWFMHVNKHGHKKHIWWSFDEHDV